ncbi:MAG: hypothetical protein I8H71_01160 [Xanthomonadaceae bacterium]|nr:hypothetical protein [Xanthomonadaceae bacterium]
MRPWSHFYPDVLPLVAAGTPDPTVVHHIRRAAQEFCRCTRAWREALDPVMTAAQVLCYDLELPPSAELVRMESATLGGHPLEVSRAGLARGRYLSTPDGKQAVLSCAPCGAMPLVVECSLAPGNAAIGIEDALFDRYAETIALGAVARLNGDDLKQARFEARCDVIKTDLWRGLAATRPRTVPNYF